MIDQKISFSNEERKFMETLYGSGYGYVKFMAGKNRKGIFPPAQSLKGQYLNEVVNSDRLNKQNLMCSISTYRKKGLATVDNIYSVCCLAVDIDFKFEDKKGNLLDALVVWKRLQDDIIDKLVFWPEPTYVEYGHRLRLIYILDSPVILPKNKTKRKNVVTWLKRIMQELCNAINNLNRLYNAEPQKLTSFIRVPSSINLKYKMRFDSKTRESKFSVEERYIINTISVGLCRKWDVHDLSDFVLPDLPEWYDGYKKKSKKKKCSDKPEIHIAADSMGMGQMMKRRMEFLKMLQEIGYDEGYREKMCFLYWTFALQSGMGKEEAKHETILFNRRFEHPLVEKDMLSHSRPRKMYNYKMSTVLQELEVPQWLADKYNYSSDSKKEYQRKYMREYRLYKKIKQHKAGNTKKQEMERDAVKAKAMKDKGIKNAQIAEELGVSVSTVKRYLTKMKDNTDSF